MLQVEGLVAALPATGRHLHTVLDDVNLTIEQASFTTILGPSGSGKTTLLRCIAGFERPEAGRIVLDGRVLDAPNAPRIPTRHRRIGFVPQEAALFPHLTVAQNVAFGLDELKRAERRARVDELLELVDLAGLGRRRPHELSGGQQQRVALVRALAPKPSLVLLDEPFSALDAKLRVELRNEVRDLLRELEATAVLVTHDQEEALTLADHLLILSKGRVVADGDPHELYETPPDVATAQFLGNANVLSGRVDTSASSIGVSPTSVSSPGTVLVECVLGRVRVRTCEASDSGECELMIRPEHLELHDGDGASAPTGGVAGRVVGMDYHGAAALVRVRLEAGPTVVVAVPGHVRHRDEHPVRVTLRGTAVAYPPSE